MLQGLSGKDTDDAVAAGAVETALLCCAAESAGHLDVHPFKKFSLFIEDVNMAVRGKNEDSGPLNGNSYKDLQLHFGKVY